MSDETRGFVRHGFTTRPGSHKFGLPGEPERCAVMLARYPCPYSREEHDPTLPPVDIDVFGYRRRPVDGPECPTCRVPRRVTEESDETIGYEEKAREVHVVRLECGHVFGYRRRPVDGPECPTCRVPRRVTEESDETIGYEEKAREVHVVRLECGHSFERPVTR